MSCSYYICNASASFVPFLLQESFLVTTKKADLSKDLPFLLSIHLFPNFLFRGGELRLLPLLPLCSPFAFPI